MAFASDLTETALQIAAMRFSFGINIICILSSTYKCNFLGADNKQ